MANRYTGPEDPSVRFWKYVDKDGPVPPHVPDIGPCWVWLAGKQTNGYGAFTPPRGGHIAAHRFSYALNVGPIPDGIWVLHRCDNRVCVRPSHLFLGDRDANTEDMIAKGRQGHANRPGKNAGSRHGMSKLNDQSVIEIRRRRAEGETCVSLARAFDVSDGLITMIVKRRRWAHI